MNTGMEDYKKDFTQFEQIINPIIKTETLNKKATQFGLGYRSINNKSNDFVMKFKIISPWDQGKAIKIVHGYSFRVNDTLIIPHSSEKLANFFAFLVTESLRKVNGSLPVGEIEIPSHHALFRAIFLVLTSKYN
jgi:hypothetical protein